MRTLVPQQPESPERASAQNRSHSIASRRPCVSAHRWPALLAASAGFFAAQILLSTALAAQTPAPPAPAPTHAATHQHKKPAAGKPAAQPAPAPAPAAPQIPNWPANNKPAEASVVWDSHGLRIDAANSSLQQILDDISTTTGAKVEGMDKDERVFGSYGPGQARDVLSQLLEGSGYNILMIGDQGQGTPRQIVLTVRTSGGPTQARTNLTADDDSDDEQPQQQDAPPGRTNFPRGPTPQQMEMQREQMRMRQQQQQGEQTGQPNQPNPPPN